MTTSDPIDAFLLVSFGGPEAPEGVIPFLERVTAGRGIPRERLELVGKHYLDRGGVSPINGHCRTLLAEVSAAFDQAGFKIPLYWGNRNSAPFLDDTVAQMHTDGVKHAVAFVTSAFSSYSGCRQYRENIASAVGLLGDAGPAIDKLRVFFNHPGFIDPLVDGVTEAVQGLDPARTHVFFTAHSIPSASAATCDYEKQITNAAGLVAERVGSAHSSATSPEMPTWSVVWQSRSGPPSMPWLEPDICDSISSVDRAHVDNVVVVPIGFISDHMEVLQDLDTDAAAAARAADLGFTRVSTSSSDQRFIDMVVELVQEQVSGVVPVSLGNLGLVLTQCSATCCPAPKRPAQRPQG
jgi:ferrochelatase